MRVRYLVGASVVVVSVLPDLNRKVTSITLTYTDGVTPHTSTAFNYLYNDFQCEVTGLTPTHSYEMYVTVNYNGTQESSSHIVFTTKSLGTCVANVDPNYGTDSQRATITSDMNYVTNMLNAVGYPGTSLYARYNSATGTAAANMKGIHIGNDYASGTTPFSTRIQVYVHELRHYFGIGDAFWQQSPSVNSRRAKDQSTFIDFYDNWNNTIGASNHYDYCLDLVHKFKTGSDIAFVNFNHDHSSIINGTNWVDIFMLMACMSASAFSSFSYIKSGSNPIYSSFQPRVRIYTTQSDVDYIPTALTAHNGTIRVTGSPNSLINSYIQEANLGTDVTSIPDYSVFKDKTRLTSITATDVTSIGKFAFSGCSNLSEVIFSDSLTTVSNDAFNECTSLTIVEFQDNLTYIGARAFGGCTSLEALELPSTTTSIGENLLKGCTSMRDLNVWAMTPPYLRILFPSGTVPSDFTIHVPIGTATAYRTAQSGVWSGYNIQDDL